MSHLHREHLDDQHPDANLHPQAPYDSPPPPPMRIKLPTRIKRPWVSWGLLALTGIIFIFQQFSQNMLGSDLLVLYGAKINELIQAGQFWRLITPTLLHGSVLHIAFNMYALYVIGPGLERYYGHTGFLLLYLVSGFAGNVLSLVFTPAPSLGASTAVFGLIAAQGIFIYMNRSLFGPRSRSMLGNILIIVVFNLILGMNPGIDNWGHLGGLLGGAAFAWFSGPILSIRQAADHYVVEDSRPTSQQWPTLLTVASVFAVIAILKLYLL